MEDKYVHSPRPLFEEDEDAVSRKSEKLLMGTNQSGIVVEVTGEGVLISGYYIIHDPNVRYANLRLPVKIPWGELEKARRRALLPPKVVLALEPTYEDKPSQEYLATLPKVHINGKLYYIDGQKSERRPVENPGHVFVYFKDKVKKDV